MGEDNKKKNVNKLIDFTVIKLKDMHRQYMDNNMPDIAHDIEQVLIEYQKGKADIIWREGLPYVKFKRDNENA